MKTACCSYSGSLRGWRVLLSCLAIITAQYEEQDIQGSSQYETEMFEDGSPIKVDEDEWSELVQPALADCHGPEATACCSACQKQLVLIPSLQNSQCAQCKPSYAHCAADSQVPPFPQTEKTRLVLLMVLLQHENTYYIPYPYRIPTVWCCTGLVHATMSQQGAPSPWGLPQLRGKHSPKKTTQQTTTCRTQHSTICRTQHSTTCRTCSTRTRRKRGSGDRKVLRWGPYCMVHSP